MAGSHYIAARRADPDEAEALLDLPESEQQWTPRDEEWTQVHELLAEVRDVAQAILAVAASHPIPKEATPRKPAPPYPRPQRGIDRARARRRGRYLAELDADVAAAQARWLAQQQREADTTTVDGG